jgi:3-oxoacyl-[acyl-carrier-protein] synthase III
MSSIVDYTDRSVLFFGDGAGAVLFEANQKV